MNSLTSITQQLPSLDGRIWQGVAIGVALSPVIAPIVLMLLPLVTLLALLAVALGAYAMLGPLQAKPRDFFFVAKAAMVQLQLTYSVKTNQTIDQMWDNTYKRVGAHRPAMYFIDEDTPYSYGDLEKLSNRVARLALQRGLKPGDTVGLMMRNR